MREQKTNKTQQAIPANKTRRNEFTRYQKWLGENNLTCDDQGRFLTPENLEEYYSIHVAHHRTGTRNTLCCIASSLQWWANNREYVGEPTRLLCRTPLFLDCVTTALERQRVEKLQPDSTESTRRAPDPHKGLKDVLPEPDRQLIMEHVFRFRKDWKECGISICWGNNAALRGASLRQFVLSDLNLSRGFGPEKSGPLARAMMFVLRRGDVHKERRDTDQQVCSWRHRDYRLCGVFSLALGLIYTLSNDNTINFYQPDKKKRADWWDIPLLNWDKWSDSGSAMRQIYKETGIISSKLTHDRCHAIQYGGSEGLAPHQIHSVSKHQTDKYSKSYQSEADREVRTYICY